MKVGCYNKQRNQSMLLFIAFNPYQWLFILQVVILSMHESSEYNYTDVVFGVLHKPMNSPINPISLSVLKTSLLDLFSQRSNLTLTKSIFGLTSDFEILKFPDGITIIPRLSPPVWFLPEVLFNFTLRNSLQEIEYNFLVLKEQLNSGLQLMPDEVCFFIFKKYQNYFNLFVYYSILRLFYINFF